MLVVVSPAMGIGVGGGTMVRGQPKAVRRCGVCVCVCEGGGGSTKAVRRRGCVWGGGTLVEQMHDGVLANGVHQTRRRTKHIHNPPPSRHTEQTPLLLCCYSSPVVSRLLISYTHAPHRRNVQGWTGVAGCWRRGTQRHAEQPF
jgi:hypothetical protein